ncbi:MAG: PQQ-binding-like beta-propeller repeat protein [Bacteroidaceae bacterium]|nr:PQQ-binding-like beta-propeller repeat protein [Bacteroidaceae bacterium]
MLVTNYFQVREATPLQTEVMETLRQLGDANADNTQLGNQIRQLDLMSRKAYFTQESHLKTGVYILLGMALVLTVCLRLYYMKSKNIPSKELDPIDEWLNKSKSRQYMGWGAVGLVAAGLVFAMLTSPTFKDNAQKTADGTDELLTMNESAPELSADSIATAAEQDTDTLADTVSTDSLKAEDAEEIPLPKITSNAFRGNNSLGHSSARGIPTSWNLSNGTNIAWKSAIPKSGYNSPVVNGRNIFITGADADARELYCYDLFTGELRWTVQASGIPGSPSTMPAVNADTGLAASTVATNGKQVCAIFATGDVICADTDGNRLWAKNLGVPDNHYGFASSLLMYGNELIIQYDNNNKSQLLALSTVNGNTLWSKTRPDKIAWSSPILANVGGKQAIIVMGNPSITAYNPNNGAELWRVECMSGEVGASPCANGGVVYGASEYATVIAIDGADGSVLWEASDYMPECSSPVATKDRLFVATSYGAVAAYDTSTGEVVKEHELSTTFYSSPVVADGKVYLFSNSGRCYIFSAGNDFNLIQQFDTGEETFATPAFTDGMMVVRTNKSLYVVKQS